MSTNQHNSNHHAEMATGIGDPQCFTGKAGPARFREGDRVRIRDLPDIFYTRTMAYTRGAVGTVVKLVYESPAAEEESWGNTDHPEWFYSVVFAQKELWPEYSDSCAHDTLETEFPERYLEPA